MNKEEFLKDDFVLDTISDIIVERDGYIEQIKKLESNWKELKEYIETERMNHFYPRPLFCDELLNKMNELEGDKQ